MSKSTTEGGARRPAWNFDIQKAVPYISLLVLVVILSLYNEHFLQLSTFQNLLQSQAATGIVAIGAMCVIITGGIAAIRVIAELKSVVGDLDRIARIVKVTGYVNSAPDFGDQPKVVNGASELFRSVFGEKGDHARIAFGTGALPDNAAVEIDVIAYVED